MQKASRVGISKYLSFEFVLLFRDSDSAFLFASAKSLPAQQLLRGARHLIRLEAKLSLELFERRRGSEGFHSNYPA
jgi:hypothetical protein